MRHIPENMVKPLLCILNENETALRSKKRRSSSDELRLCHIGIIKLKLQKRY